MISQLLVEFDALQAIAQDRDAQPHEATDMLSTQRIFVLAATNCLSAIDPAFLQPGRFENVLHVGLPTKEERRAIFELQRAKMPWSVDVDVNMLSGATEGANAASVVALCNAAAIHAMQRIPADAADQVSNIMNIGEMREAKLTRNACSRLLGWTSTRHWQVVGLSLARLNTADENEAAISLKG